MVHLSKNMSFCMLNSTFLTSGVYSFYISIKTFARFLGIKFLWFFSDTELFFITLFVIACSNNPSISEKSLQITSPCARCAPPALS